MYCILLGILKYVPKASFKFKKTTQRERELFFIFAFK